MTLRETTQSDDLRPRTADNLIAQDADLLNVEGVKLYWYRQGKDDGVEQERAKIVAWLWGMGLHNINDIADAIEAGEHLQEQSK